MISSGYLSSLPESTRRTFHCECWRSVCSGILETAGNTFLLLIAVQWFKAGPTAKAWIAAGGSLGLLLTPITVHVVQRLQWPASLAASRLFLIGVIASLSVAIFPNPIVFVVASIFAMAASAAAIPLLTQIYQENYPADHRGKLYSHTFMLRIAASIVFGWLAGRMLTSHLEWFPGLMVVFATAFTVAAIALRNTPSQALRPGRAGDHPLQAMSHVRDDRLFRQALIAWMLMGFANLMMLPMRVEYLANPRFGISLSPADVAIYTVVLPNIARLIMSPVWGRLFDGMNFFALRITLNLGFAIGILAFFVSNSPWGLATAAIVFGISNAGGDVAWGLWVTKFAPPDRVADYMSVHTFLTGVRGVVAPFAAFHAVNTFSLPTLGMVSALLILAASAFLIPEIRRWNRGRPAAPPTEEVVD